MSKNLKQILFSFFFALFSISLPAQTKKVDALKSLYNVQTDDSKKADVLIRLFEQHFSFSVDTLFHYYEIAKSLSNLQPEQTFLINSIYPIYLVKVGKTQEALEYADSLLKKIPEGISHKAKRELLNNKIVCLIRNNENKNAIESSFELLKSAEGDKDTIFILKAYTILGWANMEIEKFTEATVWLNKGIALTKNEKILQNFASLFSNNASCYNNLSKEDSALYFVNRALYLAQLAENLTAVCNALNIRANINLKKDYFSFAESDMNEAIEVREKIGDPFYIVSDMGTLATYYAMRKLPEKGIPISLKGIELARKSKNIPKMIYLYQALAENYKAAHMQEEYSDALLKIIDLKDTLYIDNSEDALAILKTRYEVQKKENIILQQQLKIDRNKYYFIGSTIVFILISLLIGLLYRNYKYLQNIKMENLLKEQKILSQEAVLKAEEAERKRIAADLHDNLGSYAAAISANTKYIKEGVSDLSQVTLQLEENAQNMVTQLSDTIWVLKNEQLPFTSLCDRFKIWIQRIMKNYPGIKYNFTENIKNDMIFSPSKMLNLFLIIKECITNVLKHSNASEIYVHFFSDQEWRIEIIDNGKGFDTSNYIKGSGLDNIQHRAKNDNWNFNINSKYNEGTSIKISGNTTK